MDDLKWFFDQRINLFPLKPGSKVPATSGSWRSANYTEKRVRDYRDSGYNIAAAIPKGKLVLDVDARSGGIESLHRLNVDLGLGVDLQRQTPTVLTAGAGFHLWLDMPKGLKARGKMPVDRYPGIDLKKYGGYVVVPGSSIGGRKYEWTRSSIVEGEVKTECLEVPEKLIKVVRQKAHDEYSDSEPGEFDSEDIRQILEAIDPINFNQEYLGRDDWIRLMMACHHATNGCRLAREEFVEWSAKDPDYDSEELRTQHRYQWDNLQVDRGITTGSLMRFAKDLAENYEGLCDSLFGTVRSHIDDFEDFVETDDQGVEHEKLPFGVVDFYTLMTQKYSVDYLIDDVMVANQPMVVSAVSKAWKTSMCLDLAISLASGTPMLEKFQVMKRQKVLFLSGESGQDTIHEKYKALLRQRKYGCHGCRTGSVCFRGEGHCCDPIDMPSEEELRHWYWVGDKVPKFSNPSRKVARKSQADDLVRLCRMKQIDVLILDPAYLALPSDDVSNLVAQGELFSSIQDLLREIGVTLILVHHNKKSTAEAGHSPPTIFDITGAGYSEFARQFILMKRIEPYRYDGIHKLHFLTGGSAGQGAMHKLYVNEGVLPPGDAKLFYDEKWQWREWELSWRGDVFKDLKEEESE